MRAELLAPAGDEQSAYAALNAGADAVYLGLTRFSARAGAANFDMGSLRRTAVYAHLLGAKVYVALNTLVKDGETEEFFRSAAEAWNAGADALLIQDIFLGKALKEACPQMVLHLSTQGGCCNRYGGEIAREYGFSRVVLARETPLDEIARVSEVVETEAFVQGALCASFSGQCYLSSFAGNHSGNRGQCKQPCRKLYSLDRAGFTEPAYALSLSDLCVGERLGELLRTGVSSLKIEGRMRRPEYIAAAVRYYRALLDGEDPSEKKRDLMRAFNRGDYTAGLAFGQDERFLSRSVQGHIGERVGVCSDNNFCKSEYAARRGDGFKILRGGREVGGASFYASARGGFFLSSEKKLRPGDEVRLTTDVAGSERVLSSRRVREISVEVRLFPGERPVARCGDFEYVSDTAADAARNAPLAAEDISACFQKTDGLPLSPSIEVETAGAFMPIRALNAFRRAFYEALVSRLVPEREPVAVAPRCSVERAEGGMPAVIAEKEEGHTAYTIIKPRDYAAVERPRGRGVYLYLPPFFTEREEAEIAGVLPFFEGIYCEGTYGIALARKYGIALFAGTGFNLTNRFDVRGIKDAGAAYFVLSKEISRTEQQQIAAEGAFALSYGGVKVMDLCFCPFGRTCAACDRREVYSMTDEGGRTFRLRRYLMGGMCRFEVYNCAPIAALGGAAALVDGSLGDAEKWLGVAGNGEFVEGATRGHSGRSFL